MLNGLVQGGARASPTHALLSFADEQVGKIVFLKLSQEDKQKLSSIEAALTEPEKEAILEECKALKIHQETA